jgi:nucleotide-binding universal stress UspA family protein
MKTILVPIDFSGSSVSAAAFALRLAGLQHWRVILLNVFEIPYSAAPIAVDVLLLEREERKKETEEKLRKLAENAGKTLVEITVTEGAAVDTIIHTINERNADLVIMGTNGEKGFTGRVFGTVTAAVIERTSCPVFAIPSGTRLTLPIQKLTFATNFVTNDIAAISFIVELVKPMNSEIVVLHIADEDNAIEESKKLDAYMDQVSRVIAYRNITFELVSGETMTELRDYAASHKTDVLILSTRSRGFFGRIFGKSVTNELARVATVPVIAFHHEKEAETANT